MQRIRQNYTSVYSFACDVAAIPKHRYCVEQPPSVAVYAILNVSPCMFYKAVTVGRRLFSGCSQTISPPDIGIDKRHR